MSTSILDLFDRSRCAAAVLRRHAHAALVVGACCVPAFAAQSVSILNVPLPVTGTVHANVTTPAAQPLPVTVMSSAVTPYQATAFVNSSACASQQCLLPFPPVPAGRRLVLASVSGQVRGSDAVLFEKGSVTLFVGKPAMQTYFTVPVTFFYEAHETPEARIFLPDPAISTSFFVTVVGTLVPAP